MTANRIRRFPWVVCSIGLALLVAYGLTFIDRIHIAHTGPGPYALSLIRDKLIIERQQSSGRPIPSQSGGGSQERDWHVAGLGYSRFRVVEMGNVLFDFRQFTLSLLYFVIPVLGLAGWRVWRWRSAPPQVAPVSGFPVVQAGSRPDIAATKIDQRGT